jgi:hypothetical protein
MQGLLRVHSMLGEELCHGSLGVDRAKSLMSTRTHFCSAGWGATAVQVIFITANLFILCRNTDLPPLQGMP